MSAGGCQCLLKNACSVTCHMACPYSVPVSMCGTFSAVKLCAGWRVHVMRVLCYARAYMSSLFRWIVLSLQGQGVGCAPRCDFQRRPQVCKARYGEDEVLCETFRLGFVWRDIIIIIIIIIRKGPLSPHNAIGFLPLAPRPVRAAPSAALTHTPGLLSHGDT
jgi:hypothetical protein